MPRAEELVLPAPAKLNLFLHVTGRRPDGYHLLQTVFQLLDYGDELRLRAGPELTLTCNHAELAGPDNLVLRAARVLQARAGISRGAAIHLHKRLPAGAGLGGGSSDAASTLLALNRLWDLNLPLQELAALGLQLGADVPVFVMGRSAWAEGVGERLLPLALPRRWFTVVTPSCHVATREIFSHRELTRNTPAIKIPAFPILGGKNDCEPVACRLYPQIREALDWLGQHGEARMTGTGASVFAAFGSEAEARDVLARLPGRWQGFVAGSVDTSPAHLTLEGRAATGQSV